MNLAAHIDKSVSFWWMSLQNETGASDRTNKCQLNTFLGSYMPEIHQLLFFIDRFKDEPITKPMNRTIINNSIPTVFIFPNTF
jgi:hypothetical protein